MSSSLTVPLGWLPLARGLVLVAPLAARAVDGAVTDGVLLEPVCRTSVVVGGRAALARSAIASKVKGKCADEERGERTYSVASSRASSLVNGILL
jgi:hypothetical protein